MASSDKNVKHNLPDIKEVSKEIPAISEYFDAFKLPDIFQQFETDTLPVINEKAEVIGIVSEYDLAKILPSISFKEESYRNKVKVSEIMTKEVWTENEDTNIEDIVDNIDRMHLRVIPIIDQRNMYIGKSITRSALLEYLTRMVKPETMGGFATPIGVYITDGRHQAGAGNLGIILTGIVFAAIFTGIDVAKYFLIGSTTQVPFFTVFIELFLFIGILRLSPLVKTHAAEHQTINAIEKGLPLTLDTVRVQPRAHRRCGTNFMVLFVGIQIVIWLSTLMMQFNNALWHFLFLMGGFFVVLSYWRQVGMWLQEKVTTAKASDKQLLNGIKAGKELLEKHKKDIHYRSPRFYEKIWTMGIIQLMTSFFITLRLLEELVNVFL